MSNTQPQVKDQANNNEAESKNAEAAKAPLAEVKKDETTKTPEAAKESAK